MGKPVLAVAVGVAVAAGLLAGAFPAGLPGGGPRVYRDGRLGYEVAVPPGFSVSAEVPELVRFWRGGDWLRVNYGCLDFGTEGLEGKRTPAVLAGLPADRHDYWLDSDLRLRRFTVTYQGTCYALELHSETESGWEVLEDAAQGFRFVGSVGKLEGGSHAYHGCRDCLSLLGAGVGRPALWDQA